MKKLYPSNSAFMLNDTVFTKYNSGCLRSILADSHGCKAEDIPELYQQVGAIHEQQHAKDLATDLDIAHYQSEVSLKVELSKDVTYSGRADFVVTYHKRGLAIHETKATVSKNVRRDAIRKGEVNTNYLAQLVSYMVKFRTQIGKLVCGYYERDWESNTLTLQEGRTFKVFVDDDGGINVDGFPSGFYVSDLLAHQTAAVKVLERNEVVERRPDKWNQKFGGPCTYCPYSAACDRYDVLPEPTTEKFIEYAHLAAYAAAQKPKDPPVAFITKKPKEPKHGKTKRKGSA